MAHQQRGREHTERWLMWALEYHLSVAVAIGFVALAGVAAETGVVMLLYVDGAYRAAGARGALRTRVDVDDAVEHGAVERVRPKMMTVTAIMAGLVPILWRQGTGADVMKRIAAPMVGGMVSSAADAGRDPGDLLAVERAVAISRGAACSAS